MTMSYDIQSYSTQYNIYALYPVNYRGAPYMRCSLTSVGQWDGILASWTRPRSEPPLPPSHVARQPLQTFRAHRNGERQMRIY